MFGKLYRERATEEDCSVQGDLEIAVRFCRR